MRIPSYLLCCCSLVSLLVLAGTGFGTDISGSLSGIYGPGTYHVVDTIYVSEGDSLTLLPGTTFIFDGHILLKSLGHSWLREPRVIRPFSRRNNRAGTVGADCALRAVAALAANLPTASSNVPIQQISAARYTVIVLHQISQIVPLVVTAQTLAAGCIARVLRRALQIVLSAVTPQTTAVGCIARVLRPASQTVA